MLMQKRQAKPDVPSRLCVGSGVRHATAGNRSSNSASDLLSMSPFLRLTRRIRASGPKPDTGVSTSLVDPAKQPKRLTRLYNPCWLISAGFSTGKPAHVRIYLTRLQRSGPTERVERLKGNSSGAAAGLESLGRTSCVPGLGYGRATVIFLAFAWERRIVNEVDAGNILPSAIGWSGSISFHSTGSSRFSHAQAFSLEQQG
jgi:hypothetical protein